MTLVGPYITKASGKIAEKVGEDIWSNIKKVYTEDKEKELVKKVEENNVSKSDLIEIENLLTEHLSQEKELVQLLKISMNITPATEFILENNLRIAEKIRNELKSLYMERVDADVASVGSYNNRIVDLERKLKKIDEVIYKIITNQ